MGSEVRAYSVKEESNLTEEMDFELIIGNLGPWDTPVQTGRYYPRLTVIAVDHWTGEEEVEYMADVLSHEFIHHLLHTKFSERAGNDLDHVRMLTEPELQMIEDRGIEASWGYLSPVAKFALRCSCLFDQADTVGNGVI